MGTAAEYQVMSSRAYLADVIPAGIVMLFAGTYAAAGDLTGAALAVGIGAAVFLPPAWRRRRRPRRVLLDDSGVTFDARTGRRSVAWAELDELASYSTRRGRGLSWRLHDGERITSGTPYRDLYAMLEEIGRLAPHVRISV